MSSTRDGLADDRWVEAHVEPDVEHGETLGNRCPEQRATTTQRVDSKNQETETGDHLDDTVDTGGEELNLVTLKTERLEDLGCVIVDGVGSSHLLADHKADGDESALAITRNGEHLLQEILNGSSSNKHALVLKLVGNVLQLSSDVLVRCRQVANTSQNGRCLFPAILLGQETRRLLVQGHADPEEDSGKSLESKGHNVDSLTARDVQQRTVIDPESETRSSRNEQLVKTSKTTTNGTRSIFGDVKRDDHGGSTNTETSDETTDIHGFDATRGSGLDDTASDGNETGKLKSPLAAISVGKPGSSETAEETSGL